MSTTISDFVLPTGLPPFPFPPGFQVPPEFKNSQYGYASPDGLRDGGPTLWICALFISLYGLSTLLHFGQALYWKRYFLLPTIVLCGLGELVGWSGRLWSAKNPFNFTPFTMQISTTIIAPTFLSAANFIILGRLVRLSKGERYSRLSPRNYSIIFLCLDVVALVIQATGGGIASNQDPNDGTNGGHIMLGGIILQLVAIVVYSILAGEFLYRITTRTPIRSRLSSPSTTPLPKVVSNPDSIDVEGSGKEGLELGSSDAPRLPKNLKLMLFSLAFSTLLLFIRSIYRTIELSNGWSGRIIETEVYFNVLDGAMIVGAMYTLNIFHPGYLLRVPTY